MRFVSKVTVNGQTTPAKHFARLQKSTGKGPICNAPGLPYKQTKHRYVK